MAVRASLLGVCALVATGIALAQTPPSPPQQQRGGTYVEPPAQVDPLYVPLGPDRPAAPPSPDSVLTLRLSLEAPLRNGQAAGAGTQGPRAGSTTVQAQLRWRPLEDRAWFVQGTAFRYLEPSRQRSWDPDFTYGFGHDDGREGHWAFAYANYTGTRRHPDVAQGEQRWNFPQGQWTAAYRFGLPEALRPWLLVGDGDAASCHADGNLVPRYTRLAGDVGSDKVSFALGCRYTRPGGWFAQATAFAWPEPRKQQPWDPDFTYGFGWTDPGSSGLTLQYANYSGNRWPGRARAPGEGQFRSGSISVGWGASW
ncbi:hypothetical protein ACPWT1_21060 [Ramlibacter sp. MMS24-I3-19]|uniref:hypothetical protein n=1 Tax=Ramlibacter sp. MMS24-I3-19 TaxID=3416606 RepID=UPI003CFDBE1C